MKNEGELHFTELIEVVERLREKDGCPWDRAQTLDTIKENIVEEAIEVVAAIEEGDSEHVREELGDLLFLIIFAIEMAKEKDLFQYNEVIDSAIKKLIYRHPHVFGNEKADTEEDAISIWKKQKEKERGKEKGNLKRIPFFSIMEKLKRVIPLLQEEEFDLIVGIKRGGLIPSAILSYKLKLPLSFMEIRLYEDGPMPKKIYDEPKILEVPPLEIIKNRRILVVDDIENTGETMGKAIEVLSSGEKEIKTFVIFGKHTDYYLFPKEGCVRLPWF